MTIPPVEPPFGGEDIPQPPQPMPQAPMQQYPPAMGAQYNRPKNDTAMYAMIAGILSLVVCGFVAGIPAIILGKQGMNKAQLMGGEGEGQAKAGFIMGIISCALTVLAFLFYAFVLVALSTSS